MMRFGWKLSNCTEEGLKLQQMHTNYFFFFFAGYWDVGWVGAVKGKLGGTWLISICLTAVQKGALSFFAELFSLIGGFRTSSSSVNGLQRF